MPPPIKTRAQRNARRHGLLFVDLSDQLAVWTAFQLIRIELEVVGPEVIIAEVWITIEKLLDVSGDGRAHGYTGMSFDRYLPSRERTGHLFNSN